jgi:ribosome biogenesis protein SSF1/2
MALSQARRIVLLSYNTVTKTIDFRHYLISVRPIGVSKSVRKIVEGVNPNVARRSRASSVASASSTRKSKPLPNLGDAQDISDYILARNGLGFVASASDVESDLSDVEASDLGSENEEASGKVVRLPQDYVGRGNRKSEKRAVKLVELGPRLELGLVKVEDGVDGKGEVLFHQLGTRSSSILLSCLTTHGAVHKTAKEAAAISKAVKEREATRAKRRKEQEANVSRKKAELEQKKAEKRDKRAARASSGEESSDDERPVDQYEGQDGLEWSEDASEGGESSDEDEEPEELPPAKRIRSAASAGSKFTLKLKPGGK